LQTTQRLKSPKARMFISPRDKIFGKSIEEIEKEKATKLMNTIRKVHKNVTNIVEDKISKTKTFMFHEPRFLRLVNEKSANKNPKFDLNRTYYGKNTRNIKRFRSDIRS